MTNKAKPSRIDGIRRATFGSQKNAGSRRWMRWLGALVLIQTLIGAASARPLAIYSFTNGPSMGDFPADFQAAGVTAAPMHMMGIGPVPFPGQGIITNFTGTTDNSSYSDDFDGKGYETAMDVLTANVTATNHYAGFMLTPSAGSVLTITNVRIDFGFDTGRPNVADTGARYNLFISTNDGATFTPIGGISSNFAGQTYPGYTISNDLGKVVTGIAGVTNSIRFHLAFAHNDLGDPNYMDEKYVFFDDIVVSGSVVPVFRLTVDDAIAYEQGSSHLAQFSVGRMNPIGPAAVEFEIEQGNLTNGAAIERWDYYATRPSPLIFTNGVSTQRIRIRPRPNPPVQGPGRPPWADSWVEWAEPPETITLSLLPSSNYVIDGPTSAVAVLYDDDLPPLPACFSDDFNTSASSDNWTIVQGGDEPAATVEFGYDYSSNSPPIPYAPGSTDKLGLKLAFNSILPDSDSVVTLVHPLADCCSSRFALSFYLYLQYDADQTVPYSPWYATAGINSTTNSPNFVWFPSDDQQSGIGGAGQFLTISANAATNTDFGGAHLWAPPNMTNLAEFPPDASEIGELLNNPPYGENGASAGVFGCDADSTNKTWLHCQLIRLDDIVRFQVNGYPVLETVVTNMPGCEPATNGFLSIGPLGDGPTEEPPGASIGVGGQDSLTNAACFAIFENFSYYDYSTNVGFTAVAVDGTNLYFNFFSRIDTNYNPSSYAFSISSNLVDYVPTGAQPETITNDSYSDGYFLGKWLGGVDTVRDVFDSEHAVFQIMATNSP